MRAMALWATIADSSGSGTAWGRTPRFLQPVRSRRLQVFITFFDTMKKRTLLATVALTALLAACGKNEPASTAAAPEAAPAPAAVTKLVVGLDDNFPPMGFRDEKNELVGFDIDMARKSPSAPISKWNSSPSTGTPRKPSCWASAWTRCGTA
jgi:polar amino acid transport system substrate-binding protein